MSDKNKLDEILLDIIEKEEQKIRRDFAEINQDSFSRGKKNLGKYFESMYNEYKEDNAVFDEVTISNNARAYDSSGDMDMVERRNASKASYASILCMKTIHDLCVAKDINDAIDKRFENDRDNKLYQQMKDYVGEKLKVEGKTDSEKKLVGVLKNQFDKYIKGNGTTKGFLSKGFDFFNNINDVAKYPVIFNRFISGPTGEVGDNYSLHDALYASYRNYTKDLQNTVICHLNYRVNDKVEPKDFLDSFKKGKLSDNDKDFAYSVYEELVESIAEHSPQLAMNRNRIYPGNFVIDGREAEGQCDLVAAVLSGKKVQAIIPGNENPVTIQHEFYLLDKPKLYGHIDEYDKTIGMKISEFFDELWENIKDMLGVSDKSRAKKLNEQAREADDRQKMSFCELIDNNFSDKLVAPEKREKIKTKVNEKSASSKH